MTPPVAAPLEAPAEPDVLAAGRRLIAELGRGKSIPAERFNSLVVDRIADHDELRAALFRLVDVTPMCRDTPDVSRHLAALLGEISEPNRTIRLMKRTARTRALAGATGLIARTGVRGMASRFIVGESVDEALDELAGMWRRGVSSTVDLLGEATVTEAEADTYARRCEQTLRVLADAAPGWPSRPHLEHDIHGEVPRVNLSVKVSAMTPEARPDDPARGAAGARDRLLALFRAAREWGAHLHIDMESLDLRETVTDLVFDLLSRPEFRDGPSAGMVLQGYLTDSPGQLDRWIEWQRSSGRTTPLTIRLVKGAYWDHEVVEARQAGWEPPVFLNRGACDRNYEELTRTLLANRDVIRPAIASHNLRSISHAIAAAEAVGGADLVEFQVLRGLGDDIEQALSSLGYRVRTYSPIGDMIAGMAYLVRRLLENTSNDSFLRARAGTSDLESLLGAP